jgi:hypothetical protein
VHRISLQIADRLAGQAWSSRLMSGAIRNGSGLAPLRSPLSCSPLNVCFGSLAVVECRLPDQGSNPGPKAYVCITA